MIEATKAYKTGDGNTFSTLHEAQAHELEQIGLTAEAVAAVQEHAEAVIALLKLKPRKSRAKAAKKTKTPKPVVQAA